MEKELLETFEAAEKAAEVAAADGGVADEDRCVDALKRMRSIRVSTKDLVATQVGKRIRSLTKHPKPRIRSVAMELFQFWKKLVIDEASEEGKKNCIHDDDKKLLNSEANANYKKSDIIKTVNSPKLCPSNAVAHSRSEHISVETFASENGSVSEKKHHRTETVKMEKITRAEAVKPERKSEEEGEKMKKKINKPPMIPKLTSMIKCNDPPRDKLRELLHEAFSKVSAEASGDGREEVRSMVDEINACDPIRVAVTVESAMFEKLGRSTGSQKVKIRSIMFNLKDSKNTDLRRRVLVGRVPPDGLMGMTAEEMASDERKLSNKQIQEKALLECQREGAPKATTDQFKCGRCGQRKCTYHQMQTRSADEPMTTFVTCVNCNNHWKFC